MTTLMTLLCLGLSVGTRTPVQAGSLPKPTLQAEPGSVIPWGSPVTFWCWGNTRAQKFHLDKTGSSSPWDMQLSLNPGNKANVFVPYITEVHAGTYQCYYLSPDGYSNRSEPLELVVTGLDSKPSLSAFLSPVVSSGENMTLQCDSRLEFDTFVLTQEGVPETRWKLGSQRLSSGGRQALFQVGPVTPDRRCSFQCYGFFSHTPQVWSHPSDPLQLLVSGASRKPSLLSPEGQIVTPGKTLMLQCRCKSAYHIFALYKEESQAVEQHSDHHSQAGFSQANFTLGPVSDSDGGQYRCIGRHNFTSWSEPSDPVDILVAGQLSYTPALSVQPDPSVSPGDNVTLLCQSSGWMDTFLLAKDGAAEPPLRIKVDETEATTQAQFFFHPVTSAHNGTYRCYSSQSYYSPYRLSHPSDPLQLRISGPSGNSRTMSTTVMEAAHPAPQDTGLNSRSHPSAHIQKDSSDDSYGEDRWLRVQGSWDLGQDAVTHTQSEEGVQLNPQSMQDEDPHGATYAQVKHTGLRQGVASCSPLSGAQLNAQDRQTEEDTQEGGQASEPDALLEVTYAQLNHLDTAQENTASRSSLSGEPPEEPSVYTALAFH
ncbi:leukocyte immunoglobulin-like receptor subfamily A member 6 [Suncus etruscus]|uniref:leukocyte immunoglobulin-like receptor subfamily A member 6 n=1 Tax=Suncus etruscus TaxID=109475 RepID=UPI002110A021|nr:leukocyte immunoglobulin-like receptor subfamily A member 6 [Suncus etruscus]